MRTGTIQPLCCVLNSCPEAATASPSPRPRAAGARKSSSDISIVPSVIFRTYSPEFEGESIDESVSYFGVHVGGRISF
jgi:hypothetical protein